MIKKDFCIEVGKRITEVRLQKHMTQQQVAEMAGISTPYYSQIENGNKTVSSYVLAQIVKALQTSSDFIMFGWPTVADDAMNRYLGQLSEAEYGAIRSFLELCIQQFRLAEADNDLACDRTDDDLATTAPLR